MIRSPTVLVVGAGASVELGFPSGGELLTQVAAALDLRRDYAGRYLSGRVEILEAFNRLQARSPGPDNSDAFGRAAFRLRDAAGVARSIDNAIDQNDGEPLVAVAGKLAIALCILEAEAGSRLTSNKEPLAPHDLRPLADTWIMPFAQALTTDVRRSAVEHIFDEVFVINFNYDRVVEEVVPSILATAYGMTLSEAGDVARRLRIWHPYGQVGAWTSAATPSAGVPYGWVAREKLELLATELRTFTEGLEESIDLRLAREALAQAERIIFIGFGFHRQNMEILQPRDDIAAKQVLGTVYREPAPAQEMIRDEILRWSRPIGATAAQHPSLVNGTSAQLLHDYYRQFTA